jgi:hypothetical protein
MFSQWIGEHGSALPLIAMLLFVGIGTLVTLYVATDRRAEHRRRMGAMAVDDDQARGGPHA